MNTPYDLVKYPYQINVVNNYRQAYKAKYGTDVRLSDKEIWEIQDSILAATSEEQDSEVLDALHEENPTC